jgi:peptidoglycan hydrolase-like protein with peptidoglycan-binding domain
MITRKTIGAVVLAAGTITAGVAIPATTAAAAPRAPMTAASGTTASVSAASVTAVKLQPWPVLRQGKNSTWPPVTVRSLQYLLVAHGAKIPVNGVFGVKTKAAVVTFQHAHHLTADGVVGSKTWNALIVTIKLGSKGAAVRAVQDQANFRNGKNGHSLDVDGIFGKKTDVWVRGFQKAEGFKADGVVGKATWQALVTESLSF